MAEADTQATKDSPEKQEPQAQFSLERIYLKDLSFETPMGVEAFKKQVNPKVNQELSTKSNKIEDDYYEVVLTVTVTVGSKDSEEVIYLGEVQQAGLFYVKGFEGNQLAQILNTHCPNILFPYARETIDSVVTKGSFPALMLPPINFDALFKQALIQNRAKAGKGKETSTTH